MGFTTLNVFILGLNHTVLDSVGTTSLSFYASMLSFHCYKILQLKFSPRMGGRNAGWSYSGKVIYR